MADYNANIKVNADTRQAESQLKKLQTSIDKLGDISTKINLQNAQQQFNKLGATLRGVGERGALGAITLGAGKAAASIGGLGAKFGILGAAAASAGAAVNGALGGVPGVITDILAQVGNVPNAFGLAAVAAMAFAPQILKASSATVGLGAAIDKAVGKQTTEKIAGIVDNIGKLNIELEATKATFESLVAGSTLNQLNSQLKDAVKESGAFHSSTEEAVVAAQQLVAVQKEQRREQKAITDLIRQAQGLQPQDVRNTEVARRVALLKSREIQQKKDLQLQGQINAELAEYERLAAEVANQTKQWANNLDRIARSSKAGVLGSQSQIQARLQEFRENRRSADIARQRSAELVARERQLAGGQYSLTQVPARGELFPGGRTQTGSEQYRAMLNEQARIQQAAASALQKSERTLIGLQAQTLRTEKDITAAKRQQQSIDERSIQLIREQNKLLLEQYRAEQRVAAGALDPASLRADRMRRVEQGRARQRRRREMTENVIIGGAFPMLFGGGPGAVLGGAAGGFIPGNPMLSVATSAVGALIDTFITSVQEAGSAIRDPIANFQKLADAGLIASRSQKQYIERLIEAGRVTEAATAIQDELIKKIGVEGVRDLQNAGAASDKLNKAFAEFSLQAQAAIAGPLAGLLSWLADVVAVGNRVNREAATQTDIMQGLSAQDKAALQREEQRIMQGANLFNEAQKRQQVSQLYQSYAGRATIQLPGMSVDTTPELQARAQTQELQAQVTLEAKKLSLVGMSLEKNGQAYVEAAKAVALQEYENRLLEIKNSWIGKAFDLERNQAMIRLANLQYAGKLKAIDAERAKAGRDQLDVQKALLGLQADLIRTTLEAGDIDVQYTRLTQGKEAALKTELRQLQTRLDLEGRVLDLRLQQQLLTKDLTIQERSLLQSIYKEQRANLEAQYQIKLRTQQLDLARLQTARQILFAEKPRALQDITQQRTAQLAGLQAQLALPFGGDALEVLNQQLEQAARRYETLVPLQRELQNLETERANIAAYASAQEIQDLDERIAGTAAKIQLESQYLNQLDATEKALLRQQQIYAEYGFIADEVSRALSDSITGLITGTTTVAEAFSRMFENIGRAFIDMATQMLAQKLFMTVVSALIPGGTGFGAQDSRGYSFGSLVDAFAEGGFVTKPTNAVIGEGGEPEYVIPASKMRTAMSRYAGGARGSGVIPGGGSQNGSENGGSAATMEPIDVRYSVERINNVDYVTADQFQRGMAQAAQQGALQGERRAMRSLKNSAATRRSVAI